MTRSVQESGYFIIVDSTIARPTPLQEGLLRSCNFKDVISLLSKAILDGPERLGPTSVGGTY